MLRSILIYVILMLVLLLSFACSETGDVDATSDNDNESMDGDASVDGDLPILPDGDSELVDGDAETDLDSEVSELEEEAVVEGLVHTEQGPVQGVWSSDTKTWSYKGIAYAAAPIGELRWRAPQPAPNHSEVLHAASYSPACPQGPLPVTGEQLSWDEDCLTLNVWAPKEAENQALPVMLWIHGGGFVSGSGSMPLYQGDKLAAQGVVVVTINYRLGALGYLVHESFIDQDSDVPGAGNYGLLDQIAALQWVQDNIEAFGGDVNNITIFGQSAGAVGVCALMASPLSQGLFHKAIMQSGGCLSAMNKLTERNGLLPPATDQGRDFAEEIGCSNEQDVAACLRQKSVQRILDTMPGTPSVLSNGNTYRPVIDGYALTESMSDAIRAGHSAEVPLLAGMTTDEGTLFIAPYHISTASQYEDFVTAIFGSLAGAVLAAYSVDDYGGDAHAAASALVGDLYFVCPMKWLLQQHMQKELPTYGYLFDYSGSYAVSEGLGAYHGAELPYLFDSLDDRLLDDDAPFIRYWLQTDWTSFASKGEVEEIMGMRDWLPYSSDRMTLYRVGNASSSERVSDYRSQQCEFWGQYFDW